LKYLVSPTLPPELLNYDDDDDDDNTDMIDNNWSEESIKTCLYLYLELIPVNHSLIHPLSQIYIGSISEVKRIILKMLETPIKSMGMSSTELMRLVEEFSPGCETFVLRIIHILTESSMPSDELVEKVKNLYENRIPDVRFLIPIISGLGKKEIIKALPQLIKLSQKNQNFVKEIFNRILRNNIVSSVPIKSPLTPAELLISLHQIDSSACDLKTIMNATSICFGDKQLYTHEVLADVIQQLIDITPIPKLFMRTLIQSLTIYPQNLTKLVVIMMQRLIGKEIWKADPKVWEGFIKCCQKIKQISHLAPNILLKLKEAQLEDVFKNAPDLKEYLCKYISNLAPEQVF
jgi:symplekin